MPIAVIYITAALLLIGAAPLPYGYYTLLRIVATGVFVWAAYISHERKNEVLPWIYVISAIIFNPIIKIHLPKELWAIIDIGAGILLLCTKTKIEQKVSNNT
jgi:hypothetical protein